MLSRDELNNLAAEKDTTPEALAALVSDQDYFEEVFCADIPDEMLIIENTTLDQWFQKKWNTPPDPNDTYEPLVVAWDE